MPDSIVFSEDPFSHILKTGYCRFESCHGIEGLAQEDKEQGRLDLLAIVATEPGTGQFRRFIKAAKKRYKVIAVWEIWNTGFKAVLTRYGFDPAMQIGLDGETNHGMMWDSEK